MSDAPSWYSGPDGPRKGNSTLGESSVGTDYEESVEERVARAVADLEQDLLGQGDASPTPSPPEPVPKQVASARSLPGIATSSRTRRLILLGVIVVLVAYFVVETAGRLVISNSAQAQIKRQGVSDHAEVRVGTSWWSPTITRMVLTRHLDSAKVTLESAQLFIVPVKRVSYDLRSMDISLSLRSRSMRITSLAEAKVELLVDPTTVKGFLGVDVEARSGHLYIGDSPEPATVGVEGDQLVIDSPALVAVNGTTRASFPIVDSYLIPCVPDAKINGSLIELRCSGSKMPGVLTQSIGAEPRRPKVDQSVPPELGPSESTVLNPSDEPPSSGINPNDGLGPDGAQGGLSTEPPVVSTTVHGN